MRDNAVFLEIRDPKFSGSFIERGDSVIFSRDKTRARHVIEDIVPATANAPIRVKIATRIDRVLEGEQTQVLFLKRQEYRTDLFGVGAIAFDLISCGRSSERFYESIRRFEFDGAGRGSVESTDRQVPPRQGWPRGRTGTDPHLRAVPARAPTTRQRRSSN